MAEEAKAKGNQAFASGRFEEAIQHFTEAIALAPGNHVLYSNRSASYASLQNYSLALEDAKQTVNLKADWAKGYSRLGAAYIGLQDYSEAVKAYQDGLNLDPNNEALRVGLADAEDGLKKGDDGGMGGFSGPFGNLFQGPEMWAKLQADPVTSKYLLQPDFQAKLRELQKNPSLMGSFMNDPRIMKAIGVLFGVNVQSSDEFMGSDTLSRESREAGEVREAQPEPEPEIDPKDAEEADKKKRKADALKEKETGNAFYKKKEFDSAIEHYTKAIELDDEDISFLTNRAAVYLEMEKYEDCIKDCDDAVERGRQVHADYKMIARALTRKGTAYVKLAKTSKDYEPAITAFNKALTEHRNPDTLKKLNDAEKAKKDLEQQEYYNPEIADEEREKGNEYFKKMLYPEAVKHYTEAIKRNPQDVKAYSNRAASYTKLTALPEAIKDAEKCIAIDPTFVKGYLRKGAAQFFMKEYDKAIQTYQEGLKYDAQNQELIDGIRSCRQQISRVGAGDLNADELKERQERGLQDPEVQAILADPVMRQVLSDFQENPKAAIEHQKNAMVMSKIQKLVNAGIVQVK